MIERSLEQQRGIHILITHYGDSFLDYPRFFYENRRLLEEYGIAYPWMESSTDAFLWQRDVFAFFAQLPDRHDKKAYCEALATPSIDHQLKYLAQLLEDKRHLLFAAPAGNLAGLERLIAILRDGTRFPGWATAEVRCLWLAHSRAQEFEGACRYHLPRETSESLYKDGLKDKDLWLGMLARLLRCADKGKLVILHDAQARHIDAAQLLKGLGLPLPPERCIPVRNTPFVSRNGLYCSKRLSPILGDGTQPVQEAINACPLTDDTLTFMDPARLHILHKAYDPAMEAMARAHGTPVTFEPPQPCAGWKPFEPPAPEVFLAIFQSVLPTLSPQNQEYCLRLLNDAWDSPLGPEARAHLAALRQAVHLPPPDVPLVSVLTLTKNHANYIGQCIESVLAQQTDFPMEHIIVDDCSGDATPRIIARYAHQYKHIHPIFLSGGAAPGRNVLALFSACKSQYAALCDGDDYFSDPQKLQKQVDFMEKHPECSLCFHPVDVRYEDGSPSRVYPPEDLLPGGVRTFYSIKDLLYANLMQTNSVMYRWRFRDGIPDWFEPSLVPADWYWHLLHAEEGIIGYLHEHMSVYRRHKGSLYASAEGHHVPHRAKHGLEELRMYFICNQHFKNKYYSDLSRLAMGIFADFFSIYTKTGDDSLIQHGARIAPNFAKDFLDKIKILSDDDALADRSICLCRGGIRGGA